MDRLDPRTSALVLIDLQRGILPFAREPYNGDQVLAASAGLARRFRAAGAPVALVRMGFSDGFPDILRQPTDQPRPGRPPSAVATARITAAAGLVLEVDLLAADELSEHDQVARVFKRVQPRELFQEDARIVVPGEQVHRSVAVELYSGFQEHVALAVPRHDQRHLVEA